MNAVEIIKFVKEYGLPDVSLGDIDDCYDLVDRLISCNQYEVIVDEKGLVAVLLYYKVRNLKEVAFRRGTNIPPKNYRYGNIVYVHTYVARPDYRNKSKNIVWEIIKRVREKELLCDTVAWTLNRKNHWFSKLERRRTEMRDNCGIIALDTLIKSLNVKKQNKFIYFDEYLQR